MKKTIYITAAAVGSLFLATLVVSCNRESKSPTTVTPSTTHNVKSLERAKPWDHGHVTTTGGFVWIGDYIYSPGDRQYYCYPSQNLCHYDGGVVYTQNSGVITLADGTSGLSADYDGSSDHFPAVYSYDATNLIFVMDRTKMTDAMATVFSGDVLTLTSPIHLAADVVSYYQSVNMLPTTAPNGGTPNTVSAGHYAIYQDGNLVYFSVVASAVHS